VWFSLSLSLTIDTYCKGRASAFFSVAKHFRVAIYRNAAPTDADIISVEDGIKRCDCGTDFREKIHALIDLSDLMRSVRSLDSKFPGGAHGGNLAIKAKRALLSPE
jgi:hypothetical protein